MAKQKQATNSVGLVQVEGGYQIKQGDRSSVLAYRLIDEKGQPVGLDGETATVRLVRGDYVIVYETTAPVVEDMVSFTINKPIELGEVWLEIVAGGYVFPSDNRVRLKVTRSATVYSSVVLEPSDPLARVRELEERQTYEHRQDLASEVWEISHPLGKYPSVTVVDTAGNKVYGEVLYVSKSQVTVRFSSAFSGSAILN